MSDVTPPCLESQGYHFIPLYYLLSRSSAYSQCSFCLFFFLCLLVHSPEHLSRKAFSIFR